MTVNYVTLALNLLALVSASVILWRTEPALARMSSATHWMIRYALLLLAGGALGTILAILGSGAAIDIPTLLILTGIALLLLCERRLRFLLARPGGRHA